MIPTHDSVSTRQKQIIVNELKTLNDYDFTEPHRHSYFEFFYFKKGGGQHRIDFKEVPISDHSIHIVGPGQVHQVERALDSEGFVCLFELATINAGKHIEELLFKHSVLDANEWSPAYQLKSFSNQLMESIHEHITSEECSQSLTASFIHQMCALCNEELAPEHDIQSHYLELRNLIRTHIKQLRKVKDYADLMGITERKLNDLVKENSNQTASELIYDQLIMEAKRLLSTTGSVKETAYELGFSDPAHFSKFFKSQTDQSPSDYHNLT